MKEPVADKIFKGVTDVHGRLLDHKPVVQAEIKQFVKEFETKRNNRDFDKLERSLAGITETQTERLPRIMQLMETQLPEILIHISAATTTCDRLINAEERHLQATPLEEKRRLRAERWAEFREKLSRERDSVDIEHQKRIAAIEDHFETFCLLIKVVATYVADRERPEIQHQLVM